MKLKLFLWQLLSLYCKPFVLTVASFVPTVPCEQPLTVDAFFSRSTRSFLTIHLFLFSSLPLPLNLRLPFWLVSFFFGCSSSFFFSYLRLIFVFLTFPLRRSGRPFAITPSTGRSWIGEKCFVFFFLFLLLTFVLFCVVTVVMRRTFCYWQLNGETKAADEEEHAHSVSVVDILQTGWRWVSDLI